MSEAINMETLASSIATKLGKMPPFETILWDGDECAEYLRVAPRHFKEKIAQNHKFPAPVRFPTSGNAKKGHPKWYAHEVVTWARKYQK